MAVAKVSSSGLTGKPKAAQTALNEKQSSEPAHIAKCSKTAQGALQMEAYYRRARTTDVRCSGMAMWIKPCFSA